MSTPLHRITSIGRAVDPRYPTNRAILVVMVAAAIVAVVLEFVAGAAGLDAARAGGHAGLLVFLVWALGREAAPDDDPAAFVAVALVAVAWGWGARPDVLPVAAILGAARIVNRTVGLRPKLTDLALAVALGGWLTWAGHWPVGVATALALLLDFRLAPRHLRALPFAAALAAITVVAWRKTPPVFGRPDSIVAWVAVGIAAAFALVMMTQTRVASRTDVEDTPCDARRVQGGMTVILVAALASVGRGDAAIFAAAGLWAVLAGVVLGRPRLWLRRG